MDTTIFKKALVSTMSINPNISPEEVYASTRDTLIQEGFSESDSNMIAEELYEQASMYSENPDLLVQDQDLYAISDSIKKGWDKTKEAVKSGASAVKTKFNDWRERRAQRKYDKSFQGKAHNTVNKVFNLKDKKNFKKNFSTKSGGLFGIKDGGKGVKDWAKNNKGAATMVGVGAAGTAALGYGAYRAIKNRNKKKQQMPQQQQQPAHYQRPLPAQGGYTMPPGY